MAKKVKIISFLIILVIILVSAFSINIIHNQGIDNVNNPSMTASTSSTINIKWDAVKKADGYNIYVKNSNGEFELYEKINGGEKLTYDFKDLKSASVYTIKITAFKEYRGKLYESEQWEEITIYTLPDSVVLSSDSLKTLQLNLKWSAVEGINGYELQYGKDNTFEQNQTQDIDDPSATEYTVTDLAPKDVYYSRIRSYFILDNEKIFSQWSDTAETTIVEKIVMNENIDPNKPMVALSFDDGPGYHIDNVNPTEEILNVLEEYNARATFFMCASRIGDSNNYLERELALGCELGNHTYDHNHYGKNVSAADISKGSNRIKGLCGKPPTIFRCPGGMFTAAIQEECKKEGMPIAYWSVDTRDWDVRNVDSIYNNCMNGVYDGCIILMHDIYPTTAEAVKKIVPELIKQGYQVVTVSELITAKNGGKPPIPGEQYVDYKTINNNT